MFKEENLPELIRLFFKASGLIREQVRKTASGTNLSLVKLKTLQYIAEKKEPTMKDIADHLAISPPSASTIVETYVKAGQLERILDKSDRRVVRIKLTPSGREILSSHMANIVTIVEGILKTLNQKEMDDLKNILRKLIKQFK